MSKGIRVEGMRQGEFDVDRPNLTCDQWSEWQLSRTHGDTRIIYEARMKLKDPQFFEAVRAGIIDFGAGDKMLVDYRFRGRQRRPANLRITVTGVREYRSASGHTWIPNRETGSRMHPHGN